MILTQGPEVGKGGRKASMVIGNRREEKQTRTRALAAVEGRKESLGGILQAKLTALGNWLEGKFRGSRKDTGGQWMAMHQPREAMWQRGKFHFNMLPLLDVQRKARSRLLETQRWDSGKRQGRWCGFRNLQQTERVVAGALAGMEGRRTCPSGAAWESWVHGLVNAGRK